MWQHSLRPDFNSALPPSMPWLPVPVTEKHATPSASIMTPTSATFWKTLSALLLLCLLFQQFTWHRPVPAGHGLDGTTPNSKGPHTPWTYDWERDGNNHGLPTHQCDEAFPELYSEIDRAAKQWKDRKIAPENIELFKGNDGGVRLLIADQQLRIIRTKGLERKDFRTRIISVLQQLQRAIVAAEHTGEPIPDIEFTIVVDDRPVLANEGNVPAALWAFARAFANPRHDNLWVIPDFHFFGAPPEAGGWQQVQSEARQHDSPLKKKIDKVVWRGVKWTNHDVRDPLINVTDGKPWADVKVIDWASPTDRMPMHEFCDYRYTINTEGRSWSARLSSLLNCDSLLMVHDVEWVAHYYHLLDTGVNCVRVERDFSDLEEKIRWYNEHLTEGQLIADTSRETFRERYTTPAATSCYWRKLMRSWESVAFKPETTETKKGTQNPHASPQLRGISFEEFVVHDNTRDYPYPPKQKNPEHSDGRNRPGKNVEQKKPRPVNYT